MEARHRGAGYRVSSCEAGRELAERIGDCRGIFDPIAKMKLAKLRRHHLQAWRKRLEEKPALVTRRKIGPQVTRDRASSSINRDMATLRAALNTVLAPGAPDTEAAWQEALKAIRNADRQRTLYLGRDQRRALLEEVDAEVEPFMRALCLLPLRPGAVAGLIAGDFDERTSELTIGKDKSGRPRRILVPAAAAKFFAAQAKGKQPRPHCWRVPTESHGTSNMEEADRKRGHYCELAERDDGLHTPS